MRGSSSENSAAHTTFSLTVPLTKKKKDKNSAKNTNKQWREEHTWKKKKRKSSDEDIKQNTNLKKKHLIFLCTKSNTFISCPPLTLPLCVEREIMRFDGKPSRSNWYFQCSRSIVLLGTCREKKTEPAKGITHTHTEKQTLRCRRGTKKKRRRRSGRKTVWCFVAQPLAPHAHVSAANRPSLSTLLSLTTNCELCPCFLGLSRQTSLPQCKRALRLKMCRERHATPTYCDVSPEVGDLAMFFSLARCLPFFPFPYS